MDGERWTSRWKPSTGDDHDADHGNYVPHGDYSNRVHASSRPPSAANVDDRWGRRGTAHNWDRRAGGGRPSDDRSTGDYPYTRRDHRQHPPRYQTHHRTQPETQSGSGTGREWVGRGGKPEGVYDLETDLMGDAFGGLDPGEAEHGASTSAGGSGPSGEDDPWSDHSVPGCGGEGSSSDGGCRAVPTGPSIVLTLTQLEEAVSGGETRSWSLERLAEASAAMCHLQSTTSPGLESSSATSPFNRREEAVMHEIATAAICRARRGGAGGVPLLSAAAAAQHGWAVAQLLWACARGQYWAGPPRPQLGTWAAAAVAAAAAPGGGGSSATAAAAADAAWADVVAPTNSGVDVLGRGGAQTWPSPAELRSQQSLATAGASATAAAAAAAEAMGGMAMEPRQPEGAGDGTNTGNGSYEGGGSGSSGDGAAAVGRWRPLAVELLVWLAADGCRLVGQLDSRSLSLVWWALAKAAAAARARHSAGAHAQSSAAAAEAAAAAADVLAAASSALVASLDARAIEELAGKSNAKLCALLYSAACVNKSSERLLRALGDELAARLERAIVLGEAGVVGAPRGRFSSRELSCIAYSCGLLGLRHEQLMGGLSEYAASTTHAKWSASAISVFMYGIANVGHRDQGLMAWADLAISAKPPADFNLRNISFLLYNFHRLRWWPRRAAEHLLTATRLHAPPAIPLISISTILMCMGSGRARDERALAHLCDALTRRPSAQLSCKDICICLTALQRLHGEDVLASQQPEVLAALHHLAAAVVERGFSRVTAACRAVPVFNHQEVSNAIFALGKLKYYSPAVLDTLRDHAARGGLDGASAWDCTAILVGLAQLNYDGGGGEDATGDVAAGGGGDGVTDAGGEGGSDGGGQSWRGRFGRRGNGGSSGSGCGGADLVALLADTVARRARTAKSQDLANTLWALTVLEGALERYRPIVTTLLEEVNRRGPASPRNPEGFNVDEQRQLWQVHRELVALPRPTASLREDLVRLGKLGMSEADHTFSRVQASFQSLLSAMHSSGRYPRLRDLLFEQELVPGGEQLIRIDVQAIIERPEPGGGSTLHRVAVEFDGPFHFMVNEPYTARIDGRTALRNRILTRHLGKDNLVCVSMAEWVAASREPTTGLPGRWRLMAAKMGLV